MNPLLAEDIFIQICYQIKDVRRLIMMEETSKWHKKIIRKNKWIDLSIRIENNEDLSCMLKTHNFSNLDLSYTAITDKSIFKLINVHTLDLSHTMVTDISVSKLINVHTLDLMFTEVTDDSVWKLVNAYELNLSYTTLTDASVSKLVNVHILFFGKTHVTIDCIEKLRSNGCIIYTHK